MNSYGKKTGEEHLKSALSTDSALLYLTFTWMLLQSIPSNQVSEFTFFWRNSVYKLNLMINLDSELGELKSKLPNYEELNFDKKFEQFPL